MPRWFFFASFCAFGINEQRAGSALMLAAANDQIRVFANRTNLCENPKTLKGTRVPLQLQIKNSNHSWVSCANL